MIVALTDRNKRIVIINLGAFCSAEGGRAKVAGEDDEEVDVTRLTFVGGAATHHVIVQLAIAETLDQINDKIAQQMRSMALMGGMPGMPRPN